MNAKRLLVVAVSALLLACPAVLAGDFNALPFAVTLGGQQAVAEKADSTHAKIAEPVAAGAELVVDTKEAMVIVNIFDCDAQGNVASGTQPLIVLMQGTNKSPISKTMDGKTAKPGHHIMNIVAGGKTARVLFTVK